MAPKKKAAAAAPTLPAKRARGAKPADKASCGAQTSF